MIATSSETVVTICCITYNHEPYIRQCLDSFVMQQTNFRFEAIVHDDASTDGTANIIREYAEKYPDIIKPICQTENQYQKKVGILSTFVFPKATGKYIALCEGDDYWTDPLKLQKQVQFLENNTDYVMCSHVCDNLMEGTNEVVKNVAKEDCDYSLQELIKGEWYFQTLSVLFLKSAVNLSVLRKYEICTDTVLVYELLRNGGRGRRLRDNMGIYRLHTGGIWSMIGMNAMREQEFRVRFNIYKVVPNKDSARLIFDVWRKPVSRRWLISHPLILSKSALIFFKHFGIVFTLKWLIEKIFKGVDCSDGMLL